MQSSREKRLRVLHLPCPPFPLPRPPLSQPCCRGLETGERDELRSRGGRNEWNFRGIRGTRPRGRRGWKARVIRVERLLQLNFCVFARGRDERERERERREGRHAFAEEK